LPKLEKLIVIKLGAVTIDLVPFIAPEHVARFKDVVVEGFSMV
jgi:cyclophilin family peptidyl-prolyl cis-trans isomerase